MRKPSGYQGLFDSFLGYASFLFHIADVIAD
jgi:hypothetical protein